MTLERMVELLLLSEISNILAGVEVGDYVTFEDKPFDTKKFKARFDELYGEFVQPYIIDSTSKED